MRWTIHIRYICPRGHVWAERVEPDRFGRIAVDIGHGCREVDVKVGRQERHDLPPRIITNVCALEIVSYETWSADGEQPIGKFYIERKREGEA